MALATLAKIIFGAAARVLKKQANGLLQSSLIAGLRVIFPERSQRRIAGK